MIAITLRHYLSRFGWEIATFWLISITNTILLANDTLPVVSPAMAVLEIVALAWITVRLVLAEDGFQTSGGWRVRPFPTKIRLALPLALAVTVVVIPAVLRALMFQRMFEGAELWNDFGRGSWWRQVAIWFLGFAVPLKLFGLLILQGIEGRARTAAWATLTLILLPIVGMAGAYFGKGSNSYGGSGGIGPRELAQGIRHALPDATDFIGDWNDPAQGREVPAAKLLAKFAIDPVAAPQGVSIRSAVASLRGSRVNVRVRALLDDDVIARQAKDGVIILRYADGTCATCTSQGAARPGSPLPFFPATGWEFSGDFISPLSLPEFEGDPQRFTRGLEMMFFVADVDVPLQPLDATRVQFGVQQKPFHFSPETMEKLFTQFPWTDKMWKETALPFLMRRATRDDIPFLLERLRQDHRLAILFINKDWTADAMPMLRELAKERIPIGKEAIVALAGEMDSSLADDLAAIALQLKFGLDEVEPALRAQPGFDWATFAKDLWRRRKYTTNWLEPYGEFWQPAFWAAQEGDFTAFRQTAGQAARGNKWETERLAELVTGDHADLIGFVRANLEKLRYDPETRKWGQ